MRHRAIVNCFDGCAKGLSPSMISGSTTRRRFRSAPTSASSRSSRAAKRARRSDLTAVLRRKSGILLDLGCGANKHDGAFGMDQRPLPGVDLVHDLTDTPWPLPDSIAHSVIMSHVWEHIAPQKTLAVMAEIHRVCRPKAHVMIAGPYGIGFRFQQDPTHCNPSNEATWCYFDPDHPLHAVYRPPPFKILSFERVPVGGDSDFNVVLMAVKP